MFLRESKRAISILATLTLFLLSALFTSSVSQGSTQSTYDLLEGLSVVESADWGGHPMTYIKAIDSSQREVVCEGIEDADCKDKILGVAAYLLPCSPTSTLACIEEVYAIDTTGKRTKASFVRTAAKNDVNDFSENLAKGLIAGAGQGGIWEFPGVIHSGGNNQYAVQVRLAGWMQQEDNQRRYESASISISAIAPVTGAYIAKSIVVNSQSGRVTFGGSNSSNNCVVTEPGICHNRAKMPADQRFGIKVRFPNELSGWFHGRIYRPQFAIGRTGNSFTYQIEASPVNVPEVEKRIPVSEWSPEFTEYVKSQWPMSNGGGLLMPGNFGKLSLELTKRFLPMVQDKATASGDYWIARTLEGFGNGTLTESVSPKILECSSDKSRVSGVVTTNAMVFSFGPPSYNPTTGSLDYTVLSPHVDETGKENVGTYDLLINSSVARCIYGFTSAPIKAEIQVIGSDGNNKVATTVLGESDGWLFLSANGFTYSDPMIRVTLSQEAPLTVQPTPVATSAPSATLNESTPKAPGIHEKPTCIKGKKSVKPTKGKCPKGFKKSR